MDPELIEKAKASTVENYEDDHNELEETLNDLRNLIMQYLPPIKRQDLCLRLLNELFKLEEDLNDHARIEEKVLLPKLMELETQILDISGAK